LHAAGKVHRDVKPSNVLVTPSGRVVLLDFGLVRERASSDRDGEVRIEGTLGYMSPEQAREVNVGPPADLYAVGVMLFEALTGVLPFDDRSIADVLARAGAPPPRPSELVPNVPCDLDDLCVELLDPAPERRPTPPRSSTDSASIRDRAEPGMPIAPL
jgi:serine/threonine protein kinase